VTNDWCPGEALGWRGYVDKSVLTLAARGCRAFHEFMSMRETLAEAGRIYRKISYGPLLDILLLDMRSYRTPSGEDGSRRCDFWADPDVLAQTRVDEVAGDLENHRRRSADRRGERRCDRARRLTPRGREFEIGNLLAFIKHARFAIRSGSRPTCTTPPRITMNRTQPRS
jgi:alkaline phosphatase D